MATLLKFKKLTTIKVHSSCVEELIKYTGKFGHLHIARYSKGIDQVHLGGIKPALYESYNEIKIRLSNQQIVSISGDLTDFFISGHVMLRDSFASYSFRMIDNPSSAYIDVEVL
ncbi:hypothetical protein FDH01_gp240 [Acinetobacter phage vB_AbaM_ME3]|uniref:Uncharacterized protein n=1 Tax=Acinetobacter phage vB_AbaM_ME3 TaxID=1837876 RepID=A0A172Q0K5_9CAUD|nr:hypothetical protein FDH01_gp240 [Acinetobacter phage vB_AbaM_ME3]AND75382.1 hypothetical protein ME3_221 [Acinetobacter phage vB_AbaM_ME3]